MKWQTANCWKRLPCKSGVYAIYIKTPSPRLAYIGSSKNLRRRFEQLGGGGEPFDNIRFIYGTENLFFKYRVTNELYLENLLIYRLQPKFNRVCKKSVGVLC